MNEHLLSIMTRMTLMLWMLIISWRWSSRQREKDVVAADVNKRNGDINVGGIQSNIRVFTLA